jgi:hypothetical protein
MVASGSLSRSRERYVTMLQKKTWSVQARFEIPKEAEQPGHWVFNIPSLSCKASRKRVGNAQPKKDTNMAKGNNSQKKEVKKPKKEKPKAKP